MPSKPNIGHLEAAAGAIGLTKAALCLSHSVIVPNLHFVAPNPLTGLEGSPFYVPTEPRPWESPASGCRHAAVSAFGMGGTNAHLILAEPPDDLRAVLRRDAPTSADRSGMGSSGLRRPKALYRPLGGPCALVHGRDGEAVFESVANDLSFFWSADHLLDGSPLAPATFFVQLFHAALPSVEGAGAWTLREARFVKPLRLDERRRILRVVRQKSGGGYNIRIESALLVEPSESIIHAVVQAEPAPEESALSRGPHLADLLQEGQELAEMSGFYSQVAASGLHHGPSFQKLVHAVRPGRGVLGLVADFDDRLASEFDRGVCLLDASFQLFRLVHPGDGTVLTDSCVLTSIDSLDLPSLGWRPGEVIWCHAVEVETSDPDVFATDFIFYSEDGAVTGRVLGARESRLSRKAQRVSADVPSLLPDPAQVAQGDRPDGAGAGTDVDPLIATAREVVAKYLTLRPEDLSTSNPLDSFGLESLDALELQLRLEKALGIKFEPNELRIDRSLNDIVNGIASKRA